MAGAALIHLICVLVPAFMAALNDLRAMKIPNWISLAMIAIFVVTAPFLFPLGEIGWRVLAAVVVFVAGFALNQIGHIGGGDVKFGSASLLFVAPGDLGFYLQILGLMSLAGVLTHRLVRASPLREFAGHWKSWTVARNFPLGFVLSGSLLFYLGLVIILK